MEALPEWLGNLTSLINLHIWDCKNLMRMQRLTKLETLSISGCPSLAERCAKESGPEWHMISHIPRITVDGVDLPKESESSSDDSTHSKPHQTSTVLNCSCFSWMFLRGVAATFTLKHKESLFLMFLQSFILPCCFTHGIYHHFINWYNLPTFRRLLLESEKQVLRNIRWKLFPSSLLVFRRILLNWKNKWCAKGANLVQIWG